MGTVTIGGTEITIRPLKRKEVKALKKQGVNLFSMDTAGADDVMDRVFAITLKPEEIELIDDQPQHVAFEIFSMIMQSTFGTEEHVKNS